MSKTRPTSGPKNAAQNYNFYCRQCGKVIEAKEMPDICPWCGNIEIDQGMGISGDVSRVENSSFYSGRIIINNVDKKRK